MVITAKFPGKCMKCGRQISVGSKIEWSKGSGASHVECPKREEEPTHDGPVYKLHGGSGYGCRGWREGQVVKSNEKHVTDGWPEYVTVLSSSSRRVYEDGMCFGVGDDSGHLYSATCREATDEESAPLRARLEDESKRRVAALRLREIQDNIRDNGERPEGQNEPDGEVMFDTFTVYGGGSRCVVGPEWIWYIQNNGSDGDDWSHNNVRTGGAGAIGVRVPRTEELASEMKALVDAI